jgi:hypothetical protein
MSWSGFEHYSVSALGGVHGPMHLIHRRVKGGKYPITSRLTNSQTHISDLEAAQMYADIAAEIRAERRSDSHPPTAAASGAAADARAPLGAHRSADKALSRSGWGAESHAKSAASGDDGAEDETASEWIPLLAPYTNFRVDQRGRVHGVKTLIAYNDRDTLRMHSYEADGTIKYRPWSREAIMGKREEVIEAAAAEGGAASAHAEPLPQALETSTRRSAMNQNDAASSSAQDGMQRGTTHSSSNAAAGSLRRALRMPPLQRIASAHFDAEPLAQTPLSDALADESMPSAADQPAPLAVPPAFDIDAERLLAAERRHQARDAARTQRHSEQEEHAPEAVRASEDSAASALPTAHRKRKRTPEAAAPTAPAVSLSETSVQRQTGPASHSDAQAPQPASSPHAPHVLVSSGGPMSAPVGASAAPPHSIAPRAPASAASPASAAAALPAAFGLPDFDLQAWAAEFESTVREDERCKLRVQTELDEAKRKVAACLDRLK